MALCICSKTESGGGRPFSLSGPALFPPAAQRCRTYACSAILPNSAHKLSNISFTPGLQNTNPAASQGSSGEQQQISTIKSHVSRSSIYLPSPPLHGFHLLGFLMRIYPRLRSCDPLTTLCTLFGYPQRSLSLFFFLPRRRTATAAAAAATNPHHLHPSFCPSQGLSPHH